MKTKQAKPEKKAAKKITPAKPTTATKGIAPKKAPDEEKKATKKAVKQVQPKKKAEARKEYSSESIYAPYAGATISTDRMQPKKQNMIYVEIENEFEEIETHLVDMNQCPQDIIDTWKGELV